MEDATRLQKMFNELTGYEKKQIDLKINGIPASPMQIVRAHGVHEEGDIKALWFNSINSN